MGFIRWYSYGTIYQHIFTLRNKFFIQAWYFKTIIISISKFNFWFKNIRFKFINTYCLFLIEKKDPVILEFGVERGFSTKVFTWLAENGHTNIHKMKLPYTAKNKYDIDNNLIRRQTFTEEELEYIKKLNIPDFIYKKDIEIHLWDCDSIYTTDWKMSE